MKQRSISNSFAVLLQRSTPALLLLVPLDGSEPTVYVLDDGLSVFTVLPACRLHEGVVRSHRDQRTLLDKMILLINALHIAEPFVFAADAYDASRKIVRGLLATGNHLVTRVKTNAVAYARPPAPHADAPRKRGRPRTYGHTLRLISLLSEDHTLAQALSPIYGETDVILRYRAVDLLWRPVGILVRFVAVSHPHRGSIVLMIFAEP